MTTNDIMRILEAADAGCKALGLTPNDFKGLSSVGQDRVIAVGLKELEEKGK